MSSEYELESYQVNEKFSKLICHTFADGSVVYSVDYFISKRDYSLNEKFFKHKKEAERFYNKMKKKVG